MSRDRSLFAPPLPDEHGAWAMLVIPLVLGLAAAHPLAAAHTPSSAGPTAPGGWLIVPAMTLLFFSRYASVPAAVRLAEGKPLPGGTVVRQGIWTAIYLGGSLACFAGALALAPAAARPATLAAASATAALGGIHTLLVFAGRDRTLAGEVLGMAGLASAAPLVVAASGRPLDGRALGAGLMALAYFVSSLAYVRAFRSIRKGEGGAWRRCIAAHAGLALALATFAAARLIPAVALAAFLPVFLRTAWGLRFPPKNLLTLGWREVAVATLFTTAAVVALLSARATG